MRRASLALVLTVGLITGAAAVYFGYGPVHRAQHGSAPATAAPDSAAAAVQRAAPSVVNIRSSLPPDSTPGDEATAAPGRLPTAPDSDADRYAGLGSAVVISERGHLLTSWHIVRGATGIEVELDGGITASARLIGYDADADLAVLAADAARSLPAMPVGRAAAVRVGDAALAIGNPMGLGKTVTRGIVSATPHDGDNPDAWFIQTDAAINEGNSGGALVDMRGDLIGINSFIVKTDGTGGLAYAVPSDIAMKIAAEIIERSEAGQSGD